MANGGTVFDRALQVSTPGFNNLLQTIQQESSRIERNRQMIQQRQMQEDLLQFKSDLEVDVFKQTTAEEKQKDRDLRAGIALLQMQQERESQIAEQVTETQSELGEAKKELAENRRQEWRDRYLPVIDNQLDIPNVRNVEAVGQDPNNLNAVYELENGQRMSPDEYQENYGWALEAQDYIERFQERLSNDEISDSTFEKEVEGTITNAVGQAVSKQSLLGVGSDEEVTETVSKKLLGRDEAQEKIAQLRQGNLQVLKEFKQGKLDFNTIGKGEHDIIRNIRSTWDMFREELDRTELAHPDSWLGIPGVDLRDGIFGLFGGDEKLKEKSVAEITSDFEKGDLTDQQEAWRALQAEYSKLDNAKRLPKNQLYPNPNFDRNTPVIDLFLTEEEFQKELQSMSVPEQLNDFGNANELSRQNMSKNMYDQIIHNPVTDRN